MNYVDLGSAERTTLNLLRSATVSNNRALERRMSGVFGVERRHQAATVFRSLADALFRSPLEGPLVCSADCPSLSPTEFDLLTAIAHTQDGGEVTDVTVHWGWPAARDIELVDEGLDLGANLLRCAGFALPSAQTRPVLASMEAGTVGELDYRELLIVIGIRKWAALFSDDRDPWDALFRHFAAQGYESMARSLHAAMRNTTIAATRRVEVNCPACKVLAVDEKRLLHAVSAFQRGREGESFEVLPTWLAPAAVRLTLPAIEGMATALWAASHRLPLRAWNFPELAIGSRVESPGRTVSPFALH